MVISYDNYYKHVLQCHIVITIHLYVVNFLIVEHVYMK